MSNSSKPKYRCLIRVEKVIENEVFVIIPSWNVDDMVVLPIAIFPQNVKAGMRLFAKINLSATCPIELDCSDIEIAEKPTGRYAELLSE